MWKKAFIVAMAAITVAGCGPARSGPGVEPVSPTVVVTTPAPTDLPPTDLPTTDAPASPTAATQVLPPAPPAPPAAVPQPTAAANGTSGGSTSSGGGAGSCGQDYYRNSDGVCVHRPASGPGAPVGATAKCNDGTYSYSTHRSGTCSHHGGVAVWY